MCDPALTAPCHHFHTGELLLLCNECLVRVPYSTFWFCDGCQKLQDVCLPCASKTNALCHRCNHRANDRIGGAQQHARENQHSLLLQIRDKPKWAKFFRVTINPKII
jgi:hypothetical protein